MKKYEMVLSVNSFNVNYKQNQLFRIFALKDIFDKQNNLLVRNGDIGGLIHSNNNLSHKGSCWIYDNSIVSDNAIITDNSIVKNNSVIKGYSAIRDNVIVNNSIINNFVVLSGYSVIESSYLGGFAYLKDVDVVNDCLIEGTKHSMSIQRCSVNNIVTIGCVSYSLNYWLKHYKRIGKKYNYSDEQILEYKSYLDIFKERYL